MSNLHNFNPGRKSWKIYANELTSISGDDLTIKPYENKNLILEVSGNNQIIFKQGDVSYNLADLSNVSGGGGGGTSGIQNGDDASLNNLNISGNITSDNALNIISNNVNFYGSLPYIQPAWTKVTFDGSANKKDTVYGPIKDGTGLAGHEKLFAANLMVSEDSKYIFVCVNWQYQPSKVNIYINNGTVDNPSYDLHLEISGGEYSDITTLGQGLYVNSDNSLFIIGCQTNTRSTGDSGGFLIYYKEPSDISWNKASNNLYFPPGITNWSVRNDYRNSYMSSNGNYFLACDLAAENIDGKSGAGSIKLYQISKIGTDDFSFNLLSEKYGSYYFERFGLKGAISNNGYIIVSSQLHFPGPGGPDAPGSSNKNRGKVEIFKYDINFNSGTNSNDKFQPLWEISGGINFRTLGDRVSITDDGNYFAYNHAITSPDSNFGKTAGAGYWPWPGGTEGMIAIYKKGSTDTEWNILTDISNTNYSTAYSGRWDSIPNIHGSIYGTIPQENIGGYNLSLKNYNYNTSDSLLLLFCANHGARFDDDPTVWSQGSPARGRAYLFYLREETDTSWNYIRFNAPSDAGPWMYGHSISFNKNNLVIGVPLQYSNEQETWGQQNFEVWKLDTTSTDIPSTIISDPIDLNIINGNINSSNLYVYNNTIINGDVSLNQQVDISNLHVLNNTIIEGAIECRSIYFSGGAPGSPSANPVVPPPPKPYFVCYNNYHSNLQGFRLYHVKWFEIFGVNGAFDSILRVYRLDYYILYNSSDNRLKHNEVQINNGLNIIRTLNPQFYQKTTTMLEEDYNGDLSGYTWNYEAGLIAQDLLTTDLSWVVNGGDYIDNSGNSVKHPYGVDYNSIFTYGLAAIKELDTIVQSQKKEIESLKADNEILKADNEFLKNENAIIKSALNELLNEAGKNTI